VSRDSGLLFSIQGDSHVCKAAADFGVEPHDFFDNHPGTSGKSRGAFGFSDGLSGDVKDEVII
jgi:hypothetical protein